MLDIDDYRQEGQKAQFWCWAAVSVSMGRYYGHGSWTQCEFVKRIRGGATCPDETFSLAAALGRVPCLAGPPVTGSVTADDLRAQIVLNRPVCLRLRIDSTLAHVVVAVRCSADNDPLITVLDPARAGSVDKVQYGTLRGGHYLGSWLGTYFTGP